MMNRLEDGVVEVVVSGELDQNLVGSMYADVRTLVQAGRPTRFLVDLREVSSGLNLSEIYDLPQQWSEWGFSRRSRIAIVMVTEYRLVEDLKFLETVTRNRGYAVSLFQDREKALAWLRSLATG